MSNPFETLRGEITDNETLGDEEKARLHLEAEHYRYSLLGRELAHFALRDYRKGKPILDSPMTLDVMGRRTTRRFRREFTDRLGGFGGFDFEHLHMDMKALPGTGGEFKVWYEGANGMTLSKFIAKNDSSYSAAVPHTRTNLEYLTPEAGEGLPIMYKDVRYDFIRITAPMFVPGLGKRLEAVES